MFALTRSRTEEDSRDIPLRDRARPQAIASRHFFAFPTGDVVAHASARVLPRPPRPASLDAFSLDDARRAARTRPSPIGEGRGVVSSTDGKIAPAPSRRRGEPHAERGRRGEPHAGCGRRGEPHAGYAPRTIHPGRPRTTAAVDATSTPETSAHRVIDATPTSFRILDRPVATLRASLRDWTRRLASARASNDRASRRDRARLRDAARTWRAATRRARVRRARAAFSAAFAVRTHGSFAEASVSIAEALWRLRGGGGGWRRFAVDDADENRREDAARRLESTTPRTRAPRLTARWIRVRAGRLDSVGESFAVAPSRTAETSANPKDATAPEDARLHNKTRDLDDAIRARASLVRATARRVRTIVADAIATAVTDASADATAFGPNGPNRVASRIARVASRFARFSDAMVLDAAAHVAADACARLTREFDFEGARRDTRGGLGFNTPVPSDVVGSIPRRACEEIVARCPPPSAAAAVAASIRRARAVERSSVAFRSSFDERSSATHRRRRRRGIHLAASFSGRRSPRRVSPRGDESSDEYESSTVDVASFAAATAIRIERANERGDAARRG